MPSKARMILTSAVAAAIIQAQQTRMIAHSHRFKTTLCQRSEAVTGGHRACPQKQPLPIYRPAVRGMDGLVSQPKWRASPLVASYDRQALAVDEFLPARIHTGCTNLQKVVQS